ncbi:ArsI/CadI family heavy metal resistance metalloenzyme [Piscirickettsia salmonis]|uniref:ArsI/CadI family heavy metal resistance metalloenzyme n=1 Tax=Piscirickettsia salmonis TaxID=1238 RepID=UPI000F095944|nr:glyoxalase/bleomycin resistance/extradiol dioxygenase family protein [Piscirickettsiaceae bacterium NZ-RLO2]
MQRIQLALNVENIDEAVEYYSKLFGVTANKRKLGYANFIVNNPPLKLVLLEGKQARERLNHLGVEAFEQADVDQAIERFDRENIRLGEVESGKTCCFAKQNKVWSADPQGMRWEWYRVLENSEAFGEDGFDTHAINHDKAQADIDTVVCCN